MPKVNKKLWKCLFVIYILILIKLIVFKYPLEHLMAITQNWEKGIIWEGLSTANFTLGKSIRMYIKYFNKFPFWNGFANLVGNILVFVPFGFLLPKAYPGCSKWWRVFYCSTGFVMCVELFQLLSAYGAFDVDDIVLNVLGAMLGYGLFSILRRIQIGIEVEKKVRQLK